MSSDIDDFLGKYPPQVSELSQKLRAFVMNAAPQCTETLHSGWKVISYGYRKKFCAIAPHARWVNLQFHSGATLSDKNHILKGSGKAMRHAKTSTTSDLNANLKRLIVQASKLAQ